MQDTINEADKSLGTIVTVSGQAFDILRPRPEMVNLRDIAHALSMQCRYNGHVPTFYSVAEHSVRVAQWMEGQGYGKLECLAGLMHDAAEAYVGDMVRPMKKIPALGSHFIALERGVEEAIGERYDIPLGSMPVAVKQADMAIYHWETDYIRTGEFSGWPSMFAYSEFINHFYTYGGKN